MMRLDGQSPSEGNRDKLRIVLCECPRSNLGAWLADMSVHEVGLDLGG